MQVRQLLEKPGDQGDRVSIYLPMVPELAIAMLAAPDQRVHQSSSVAFIGSDRRPTRTPRPRCDYGQWRLARGKVLPLKTIVDEALEKSPSVQKCIVLKRTGTECSMQEGRDVWWHDLMAKASPDCPAEPMDAEASLFILYTSGSTGKPKGVRHTTAGYNLYAKKTFEWVFDNREDDVFWCTADIGWITGHSYIVYGPLSAGATSLIFEGAPNWPDEGRFWEIIEKYRVNVSTRPHGDPRLHQVGRRWVDKARPLQPAASRHRWRGNQPEAWMWYHRKVGPERCPIVDTWWQTETGGIMMTPLPAPRQAGSCCTPLPGIVPEVVGEDGKPVPPEAVGG